MGNLSDLFGSVQDAYCILFDPFFSFLGLQWKFVSANLSPVSVCVFYFQESFWMLRMRIVAVCDQLQMCFRFCDPSAVVSVYIVTVGLVWYGLSALIHVSFFIFIFQPSYFLECSVDFMYRYCCSWPNILVAFLSTSIWDSQCLWKSTWLIVLSF